MNDEEYKRFRKLKTEDIQCIYNTYTNNNFYFLVIGSSHTKYKVVIESKGKIYCSCPDFKHNARKCETTCKHCLYIIFIKLKLFKDVNHTFFKRHYFTPDEVQMIYSIYKRLKKS